MNDHGESIKDAKGFLKYLTAGWPENAHLHVESMTPVMSVGCKPDISRATVSLADIDTLGPFGEERNWYYTVNPLSGPSGTGKGGAVLKTDIACAVCVHLDLDPADPPEGASPEEQQAHLQAERKRLRQQLADFSLAPSFIVDSTGGYQAIWQLKTPATVAEAEAVNRALCDYFKTPDHCHSAQHLMRMPFTFNVPGYKKLAKGRTVVPTVLVTATEAVHSLSDFAFLPPVAATAKTAEIQFDQGIDELSIATRFALHQQHDPDLKRLLNGESPLWSQDGSGSGRDHAVALTLSRLGYTPAENLLLLSRYEHGKTSRVRDQEYLERTVRKVYPAEVAKLGPGTPASSWRNLTLQQGETTQDDLHKKDPPWPHAIYPLRPMKCLSILGGANGIGKSTEGLSQDLHIATGRAYFGMPVLEGRALFFSLEDPRPIIKARIQAWLEGVPEAERPSVEAKIKKNFFFYGSDETAGMQLTTKAGNQSAPNREAVELLVQLCQGAVSVSVETIAMLNGGDEMNTDFMQLALALKEIAARTGASAQAVHHISKEAVGKTPSVYSLRGASALGDALRGATIMHELWPEQMKALAITQVDGMPVMGVYNVKSSYAPCHAPIYVRRMPGPRFVVVDGSEAKGMENARLRLLSFLQRHENREGLSLRQLQESCTKFAVGKRDIEGVLTKLELIGKVGRARSSDLGKKGRACDIWFAVQ